MTHNTKSRWLAQVLVLSLFLNVALLFLFFFFVIRENRLSLLFAFKPAKEESYVALDDPDFLQSPEFIVVQTLFARAEKEVSSKTLQKLLLEGDPNMLHAFYQCGKKAADFSAKKRQEFLLDYLHVGSKTAAHLLVILDCDFALSLPTSSLELLVDLIEKPAFLEKILEMGKPPSVIEKALVRLTQLRGKEEVAARYDRYLNTEKLRPIFRQQVPITQTQRTHIVQPGESLWLISKKYQVSIEKIMVTNNLRSTTLQPGEMLKIPFPEQ